MDVEEDRTGSYVPDTDGVSEARARLLHGAIVCPVSYIKGTHRVNCTFCHNACYRLVGEPPDYISVCTQCLLNILGPPPQLKE